MPDQLILRYLSTKIRRCPRCDDNTQVQVVVYSMPARPPLPEEESRVVWAGCLIPRGESAKWHCPDCEIIYTAKGTIVEPDPGDELIVEASRRDCESDGISPAGGVIP